MGNSCVGQKKRTTCNSIPLKECQITLIESDIKLNVQQVSCLQQISIIQKSAKSFILDYNNRKALELYQISLQKQKSAKLHDSLQYALSLDKKGELLFLMAKTENNKAHAKYALSCCQETKRIKKYYRIQNSKCFVNTLHNIGNILHLLGQNEKAVMCFNQGIEIVDRNFGRQNEQYFSLLNSKGQALLGLKKYDKALQNYEQVEYFLLKMQREQKQSILIFDLKLWGLYMNIGSVYMQKEDIQTALKYYYKSLEMREAKCGKYSIHCFEVLTNIVEVYRVKKDRSNYKKYLSWIKKIQNHRK